MFNCLWLLTWSTSHFGCCGGFDFLIHDNHEITIKTYEWRKNYRCTFLMWLIKMIYGYFRSIKIPDLTRTCK